MNEWERILSERVKTTQDPEQGNPDISATKELARRDWYDYTKKQYNLHLLDAEDMDETGLLPALDAVDVVPEKLICITEANRKNKKSGKLYVTDEAAASAAVHFYTWDIKFNHTWAAPLSYVDKLKRFEAVLAPDFSVYLTMPLSMQLWQLYKSRAVARIWQDAGLTVIPSLTWSTPDVFDLFFTGIPKHSVVAVSSVGCMDTPTGRQLFREGVDYLTKALEPSNLLVYTNTKNVAMSTNGVPVTWYENPQTQRFAKLREQQRERG